MADKEITETSEAQIAVHWGEENYYMPNVKFIAQANMTDETIYDRFGLENFPDCFKEYADLLDWYKYWDEILDASDAPCFKWFKGGLLNVSYNCVDRHLAKNRNKTAIHFVPELEEEKVEHVTYQELWVRVNETAAVLRDFCGLKAGDRVTLHLPMTVELPVTMLACARLGIIHSQVFGGFSGNACADRIVDSGSTVLITMDAYYRGGKLLDHKEKADEAVSIAAKQNRKVDKVLVWQRYPGRYSAETPMVDGRDFFVNEVLKDYYGARVEPVKMPAEAPLFLMYTSGTTGKPKGCQHGTGGFLAYVAGTSKYVQDIHPEDVYWCMADIGWITGHSYIVYGPLAICASTVIYEGVPIEPEVWKWYYEVVGKGKAAIVDTWWQTETGGFLCSTIPAIKPMKPGSAGPGMPGIHPIIYDDEGKEVPAGQSIAGNICIRNPWPGMFQTIWGDRDRFVKNYFERYCGNPESKDWRDWPYLTGDAAVMAEDGYVRILGRIDDVINVSGHRLGTKELESAALVVEEVAEAAVVPVKHDIKGKEPDLYVALKPGYEATPELAKKINDALVREIGSIAKARKVWIVPDMPKTRSGKIMRRVLAALSNKGDVGDTMTLANPEVVEEIKKMVQG